MIPAFRSLLLAGAVASCLVSAAARSEPGNPVPKPSGLNGIESGYFDYLFGPDAPFHLFHSQDPSIENFLTDVYDRDGQSLVRKLDQTIEFHRVRLEGQRYRSEVQRRIFRDLGASPENELLFAPVTEVFKGLPAPGEAARKPRGGFGTLDRASAERAAMNELVSSGQAEGPASLATDPNLRRDYQKRVEQLIGQKGYGRKSPAAAGRIDLKRVIREARSRYDRLEALDRAHALDGVLGARNLVAADPALAGSAAFAEYAVLRLQPSVGIGAWFVGKSRRLKDGSYEALAFHSPDRRARFTPAEVEKKLREEGKPIRFDPADVHAEKYMENGSRVWTLKARIGQERQIKVYSTFNQGAMRRIGEESLRPDVLKWEWRMAAITRKLRLYKNLLDVLAQPNRKWTQVQLAGLAADHAAQDLALDPQAADRMTLGHYGDISAGPSSRVPWSDAVWWGYKQDPRYWAKRDAAAFRAGAPSKLEFRIERIAETPQAAARARVFGGETESATNTGKDKGLDEILYRVDSKERKVRYLFEPTYDVYGDLKPFVPKAGPEGAAAPIRVWSNRPVVPVGGMIPLPVPDQGELRSVRLRTETGAELAQGRDFTVEMDPYGKGGLIRLGTAYSSSALHFEARFGDAVGAAEGAAPAPRLEDRAKLGRMIRVLEEQGFKRLASSLKALERKPAATVEDLARVFASSSRYSFDPEKEHRPAKKGADPFVDDLEDFKRFLRNGTLCYQCDGSNLLLSAFMREYFGKGGPRPRYIGAQVVDPGGNFTVSPGHAMSEVIHGGRSTVIDATPSRLKLSIRNLLERLSRRWRELMRSLDARKKASCSSFGCGEPEGPAAVEGPDWEDDPARGPAPPADPVRVEGPEARLERLRARLRDSKKAYFRTVRSSVPRNEFKKVSAILARPNRLMNVMLDALDERLPWDRVMAYASETLAPGQLEGITSRKELVELVRRIAGEEVAALEDKFDRLNESLAKRRRRKVYELPPLTQQAALEQLRRVSDFSGDLLQEWDGLAPALASAPLTAPASCLTRALERAAAGL